MATEMSSFSIWLASKACHLLLGFLKGQGFELLEIMCLKRNCTFRVQNVQDAECCCSLLDLPDLVMEQILCRLPPHSLCQMATVCKELRNRCTSDHLWELHLETKWGNVVGSVAYREWQKNVASHRQSIAVEHRVSKALMWPLSCVWPLSWLKSRASQKTEEAPRADSFMAWYWALETGAFWFPAQVFNREYGHVGFLLSCYDAELCYDRRSNTFRARYPPHGSRTAIMEERVHWERLRASPIDTPAYELHVSDCLNELRPGHHVEVQWRRNKGFPYGWWYGVVGHLDMCHRESWHCRCHLDDTLWLEFNQYTPGSRWRRAALNRKTHTEEGNEAEGFYGGVRKLCSKGEISMWKQLWPNESLD